MATKTASGLIKPDYTDDASVLPINKTMERIDKYGLGAQSITGDTFPTNPWEGMKIYKEDFQELYIFSTLGGNVVPGQWWLLGCGRKIDYVPVVNNVTLGTGGVREGQYFRVGHNSLPSASAIYYRIHIGLGTGGDVTGNIELGLPGVGELWSTGGADLMKPLGHALGAASAAPAGSAIYAGVAIDTGTAAVGPGGETQGILRITPDTEAAGSLWAAALPFDWAANSHIWVQGWYWPDQNGTSWGV